MIKTEYNPLATIVKATNKLVDLVKPTFGPSGNKVIIPNSYSPNDPSILDDGASIAKEFQLEDEFENTVVNVIKQVALKTNSRVGDGTTGSLILLQAIINEIAAQGKIDTRKITEELKIAAKEAKDQLLAKAKKITKLEDLEKVARISIDDEKISKVIAGLIYKTGHEGVIAVQQSNTMEVTSEVVDGFDFDKGYVSPYMVTNQERLEAELDRPVILITDYNLSVATDVVKILEKIVTAGYKNIVMVAEDITGDALAIAVVNKMQGKFNTLAIQTPGYDVEKDWFLNDLATITGGTFISKSKGMKLDDFELDMLGHADKVTSKAGHTVVLGGKGKKPEIKKAVDSTKTLMETATGHRHEQLQKRLARLQNGIAVIKVGAATEHEMRALCYKVEDAVNAVKVAFKSGIVCGGGLSLFRLKTSSNILDKALKEPKIQLFINSGINSGVEDITFYKEGAFNVVTNDSGDYMKVGVIDPVDVLIAQVESAVSIACLLIQTTGIMAEEKEKEKQNA